MRTIESLEQELAIAYKNIQHNQEWRDNLSYELTSTKRALWLARAERAKEKVKYCKAIIRYDREYMSDDKFSFIAEKAQKWEFAERKCRSYADKFKEEK